MAGEFLGLERRLWRPDHLFRVIIRPGEVCGARIGGGWAGILLKFLILNELAPFVRSTPRPSARRQNAYVDIVPCSQRFLEHDRHNFRFATAHVTRVEVAGPPGTGVSGVVTFHLRTARRKLVLRVEGEDMDDLGRHLVSAAFRVERTQPAGQSTVDHGIAP